MAIRFCYNFGKLIRSSLFYILKEPVVYFIGVIFNVFFFSSSYFKQASDFNIGVLFMKKKEKNQYWCYEKKNQY